FVAYPGPKMHKTWQSRMTLATGRSACSWTVEARIPRAWLGLTGGAFGFNAGRNRIEEVARVSGKTETGRRSVAPQRQHSVLTYTGTGWHRPWLFLPMRIEDEAVPPPPDPNDLMQQMVHGMAGHFNPDIAVDLRFRE
ncbi:MAG: hypothetical protein QME60_09540, partial [Verrucomicrobiota bacterium]|nr:hypothetical protein [Verrucomicrobiota bacterium]